jgi:hypothetical protein
MLAEELDHRPFASGAEHGTPERRVAIFVLRIDRRTTLKEQMSDPDRSILCGEMEGGKASVVSRVRIGASIEESASGLDDVVQRRVVEGPPPHAVRPIRVHACHMAMLKSPTAQCNLYAGPDSAPTFGAERGAGWRRYS